ncbi:MAG: polysaccharide biosynthesis tyrosine autokinase [Acidobacteria bacterium]|nr:polysaccharide biosynthesis tyrosine autokinase [Acidobacteriota bacterium]
MPDDKPTRRLLPPGDASRAIIPIPDSFPPYLTSQYAEPEPEETTFPLSHYLWVLKRHRWKILAFVLTCTVAVLIISSRLTPIYESTATVDIDRQTPMGVIGQEATRPALGDAEQFLATQVNLIQSDSVLRPVVQKYNLIDYEKEARDSEITNPANVEDAPVLLRNLKVTRPPNTYLLQISYRSPDPHLAAEVANGIADSYILHTYNIRFRATAGLSAFMEKQMEDLRAKMERSGAALAQFERELNVINPEQKTSILSAQLLQLNTEYTNSQADRVKKEAAFNSVKSGTLEAAQVSSQGESLRNLTGRLGEAQEKFAQVKEQYGTNHPEYKKALTQLNEIQRLIENTKQNTVQQVAVVYREALNRELMLQKAVAETKAEFDRLNARSFEYQQVKREAEADKNLYEELVRKIKEAGINASFQNSSIRMADAARPAVKPVYPNIPQNVALAFVFSILLAVGTALISESLDRTIRDPEQVSRMLKTEVVGTLPLVKPWVGKLAHVAAGGNGNGNWSGSLSLVRTRRDSGDKTLGFDDAIRTLRTSILLSASGDRVKSLLVSSATPGEGKTLTSVHLAVAHASQRHKTLLIDGDLRRPGVHPHFRLPNDKGLANILNGGGWKDAVFQLKEFPHLDVLPAGPPSRRAADFLGAILQPILEEASSQYDLIIVDSPPLLGFAEPLQIAALVDGVVIVALAGQTDFKAVGSVINALNRLRANIVGVVLNEVHEGLSDQYSYYGYYGKNYSKYYNQDGRSVPGD